MNQMSLKLKGSNFFHKERWKKVREVVEIVNKVTMRASMLAKAYVLKTNYVVGLTADFYNICFKIIMDVDLSFRGEVTELKEAKKEIFLELKSIYHKEFNNEFIKTKYSISQILGAACNDLETAALNNIQFHYNKYVTRYLYTIHPNLTKYQIAKLRNHLLYDHEYPEEYESPLPPRDTNIDKDLKERPWIYLQSMIYLSRLVEAKGSKPLSPIPLRRSYIPKHIHIDTNALIQLLMTSEDIKEFINLYELEYKIKLNLKNKGDLGNSFKKIFGRDAKSSEEDFDFYQEYWKFLCNFKNPKFKLTSKDYYFGNSIVTDGCSISLSFTKLKEKKKFAARKVVFKVKKDEFDIVNKLDKDTLYLGCDPGKKDLVAITDGVNMFKYTNGQRDYDTKKKWFMGRNLNRRREIIIKGIYQARDFIIPNYYPIVEDPNLAYYEEQVLSKNSSRTSNYEEFVRWTKAKLHESKLFSDLYEKPVFRNDRFTKYTLKESSEQKMLNRLETFIYDKETSSALAGDLKKPKIYKRSKDPKEYSNETIKENIKKRKFDNVIMFYGDWGRNPNLKNSAPTPGIALRRKIHKRLPTMTVNEHYTSQTCPCCHERNLENPKLLGPTRNVSEKHHLLRCENVNCQSRWWNRNVVGSYNILFKGLNLLTG
jgi:hypothetical protein